MKKKHVLKDKVRKYLLLKITPKVPGKCPN